MRNSIFKRGSTTYYYASTFFPRKVRSDVEILYNFVRVADDYVDAVPQNREGFMEFKREYLAEKSDNVILRQFFELERKYNFNRSWGTAFLNAMEQDLTKREYETIEDLEEYMYGSAEVIGLYMNRLLGIPKTADCYAKKLGQAMQIINFIRDINEDRGLGRVYIPQQDLKKFGLQSENILNNPVEYQKEISELILFEVGRYYRYQEEAEKGYEYLPHRFKVAIKTASDMYNWTARKIEANPMIVFQKKVKPQKRRVLV